MCVNALLTDLCLAVGFDSSLLRIATREIGLGNSPSRTYRQIASPKHFISLQREACCGCCATIAKFNGGGCTCSCCSARRGEGLARRSRQNHGERELLGLISRVLDYLLQLKVAEFPVVGERCRGNTSRVVCHYEYGCNLIYNDSSSVFDGCFLKLNTRGQRRQLCHGIDAWLHICNCYSLSDTIDYCDGHQPICDGSSVSLPLDIGTITRVNDLIGERAISFSVVFLTVDCVLLRNLQRARHIVVDELFAWDARRVTGGNRNGPAVVANQGHS